MSGLGLAGLAVLAFAGACAEPVGTISDLRVDFRVQPSAVASGDSLIARLTIINPTDDSIKLFSGSSCVTTLDAFRDNTRVDLRGTAFGCRTVVSTFVIPPRDSLVMTFDLVAMLREQQPPWQYVTPPPPGIYQLRAAMQVGMPDQFASFEVTR